MPQNQDLGCEMASRLEAVAQHADEQEADAIIRRSCSDSLLIANSNGLSFRKRHWRGTAAGPQAAPADLRDGDHRALPAAQELGNRNGGC
jgi:hypothetical protein